jgi:hypothetical protein
MYRSLIYLALAVYVLAVIGAACAPTLPAAEAPPAPRLTDSGQPLLGFAFSLHHTDDLEPYLRAVDDIADMGFNSLEIVTPAYQTDGAASDIAIQPGLSAQREDVLRLLKRAHQRGLRTSLMPIVLFSEPRGNEWRGKIKPEHWNDWWNSYRKVMDYFLDLADEGQADAFAVGSELLSTEEQTDQWMQVIAAARRKFRGRHVALYYSTNWDHYQTPTFWSSVDMIGICCYWDLTVGTGTEHPTHEQLARRWDAIRKQVLSFGREQNRPVLFTEIGYPSLPWGLKDPWNYVNTKDAAAAPEVQAEGFASYLNAWGDLLGRPYHFPDLSPARRRAQHRAVSAATQPAGVKPVAGVFFYSWEPLSAGGPADTGYGIKGKPTYDLLKLWLAQPATQPAGPALPSPTEPE